MNELTEDPILAGEHAQRIITDPVVQLALKEIKDKIVNDMLHHPSPDLEKLRMQYDAVEWFEGEFAAVIANGRIQAAKSNH